MVFPAALQPCAPISVEESSISGNTCMLEMYLLQHIPTALPQNPNTWMEVAMSPPWEFAKLGISVPGSRNEGLS
jgi:hypothetical protein